MKSDFELEKLDLNAKIDELNLKIKNSDSDIFKIKNKLKISNNDNNILKDLNNKDN